MANCVCLIRQSQGTDDSVSLQQQRRDVPALAEQLGDPDPDVVDLGIHTGFSIHSRDRDQQRLDANPEIQELVDNLEAGKYDYLCALDERRVCRDQFLHTIERAAKLGGCEIRYVSEQSDDELTQSVRRVVDRETKKEEIEKAKRAHEEWAESAEWCGSPPMGLQFGPDKQRLVPDEKYGDVLEVFDRVDEETYAEIAEDLDISTGAITNIRKRGEEWYRQFADRSSRVEPLVSSRENHHADSG